MDIDAGNIGSRLSKTMSKSKSESSAPSGDHNVLALQGELVENIRLRSI